MAEALARIDYPDLLDPVSAGSRPAGFVHPLAVAAIEELGFDVKTQDVVAGSIDDGTARREAVAA